MAWMISQGRALADYVSRSILGSGARQPAEQQPLAQSSGGAADAANAHTAVSTDAGADAADLSEQASDFAFLPDEQRSFVEAPEWQGSELPRNWFSWRNLWVRHDISIASSAAICAILISAIL
jgi:hypothetical protein